LQSRPADIGGPHVGHGDDAGHYFNGLSVIISRRPSMSWIDCFGFGAPFVVIASFYLTTSAPLRRVALAGNILFCLYGLLAHMYLLFFLHMILFPINLLKLYQIRDQK
jgi:hypothetical protein